VAVRVDHAGHDDPPASVNLERVVGSLDARSNLLDHTVDYEDVTVLHDVARVGHGEDDSVTKDDGTAVLE